MAKETRTFYIVAVDDQNADQSDWIREVLVESQGKFPVKVEVALISDPATDRALSSSSSVTAAINNHEMIVRAIKELA
jgi:hypothetical protein